MVPPTDYNAANGQSIKQVFANTLNRGIKGISFSPYAEGQNIGDQLSRSQVQHRMKVISPYTKWVRSFSCIEGNEFIPQVAREYGLKTMVGAWISDDKKQNEEEIEALIRLAKDGYVDIAVVGNEVLLREDLSLDEILEFIYRVKRAIPNIKVGYVDTYFTYHQHPALADACDVILANCYPFWEGVHIDKASGYFKQMVNVAQQAAKGKPVIITETGWPDRGDAIQNAQPSPENAMKYFVNVNALVQSENLDLIYFSSFDESWKLHHEGDVGQRWGLWDKNEKLKY
ncbi:UNVERIFIED_CONTAM: hypothetical protein GTU68_052426 [Idotea baltica]|nr:hypothetical protein [Idotea baltica]